MTDYMLHDVVDTTRMIGPQGRYSKGICKTCSKQYKVTRDEFELETITQLDGSSYVPRDVDIDMLEYVATMRAWNCCHDGEKPLDGLPEMDAPFGIEWQ